MRLPIAFPSVKSLFCVTCVAASTPGLGHGWITSPPSRQDQCAEGRTAFDCGALAYEPQSVEAPKGSMQCSGGSQFSVLDTAGPWPVTSVGDDATFTWQLTVAHRTQCWDYFVDGIGFLSVDDGHQIPALNVSHRLTGLPSGRHTILARWNIGDTGMAFYSCVDVQVGG